MLWQSSIADVRRQTKRLQLSLNVTYIRAWLQTIEIRYFRSTTVTVCNSVAHLRKLENLLISR